MTGIHRRIDNWGGDNGQNRSRDKGFSSAYATDNCSGDSRGYGRMSLVREDSEERRDEKGQESRDVDIYMQEVRVINSLIREVKCQQTTGKI